MAVRPAVEALLADLRDDPGLDLEAEVLAAAALSLADTIDDGDSDASPASIVKELRSVLEALRPKGPDDADDWLDGNEPGPT